MTRIEPVPSVALVVLDGWGLAPRPGNAISQASTPTFNGLWERYPHTELDASGRAVGLPDGQMGNSEVGHMNLGAGAIVKQDLLRINDAIADGSFFENEVLTGICERARSGPRGRCTFWAWSPTAECTRDGSTSRRASSSRRPRVPDLVVHAFTDGRDTLPDSAVGYIEELERWLRHAGRIGTVSGRYYAMDRDRRWERTSSPTTRSCTRTASTPTSAAEAVRSSHERGETDEFVRPTVIGDYDGVADGDAALFFNFRPDRMRQLVRALGEPDFHEFPRGAARGSRSPR